MPVAHNLKVLIVDDQSSMRQLLRYSLEKIGIRDVTEGKSGAEALSHLQTTRFDLVISDWNMENVDGLQLLKVIRGSPLTSKVPFIMSTGNKDRAKVQTAVQAGVNNYIVKPFNVETLKHKIEQVIGPLT